NLSNKALSTTLYWVRNIGLSLICLEIFWSSPSTGWHIGHLGPPIRGDGWAPGALIQLIRLCSSPMDEPPVFSGTTKIHHTGAATPNYVHSLQCRFHCV